MSKLAFNQASVNERLPQDEVPLQAHTSAQGLFSCLYCNLYPCLADTSLDLVLETRKNEFVLS